MKRTYRTPRVKIHTIGQRCGICQTSPAPYSMQLSIDESKEGDLDSDM